MAAVGVGAWLQFGERQALDSVHTTGRADSDRVDVRATVQRVDAAGRELVLRVLVTPRGALAEAGGTAPVDDLTLYTSPSTRGDTAPGTPPIGCPLDYLAFLWAETVIAFCLITVVVSGVRSESRAEAPADAAP
ncbi:DUF4436 family protein [Streptomyces sp. NBC_00435]|uniref:DUF4436 family protein n=1 Tax=Streptomyces sp. NBC_00435 TaxID=2903649 RepID=UPI003FA71A0C